METWMMAASCRSGGDPVDTYLDNNRTGRRIDETQKLVTLLQQGDRPVEYQIEKLETKVETRDEALSARA